jgi:cobalamin-dependent methionine synthase I
MSAKQVRKYQKRIEKRIKEIRKYTDFNKLAKEKEKMRKEAKKAWKAHEKLIDDIMAEPQPEADSMSGYVPTNAEIKDQLIIERLKHNAEIIKAIEREYQQEKESRDKPPEPEQNV